LPDGWAKAELVKRLEGVGMRLLPEDRELEGHTVRVPQVIILTPRNKNWTLAG
jgi:hypothetical protein